MNWYELSGPPDWYELNGTFDSQYPRVLQTHPALSASLLYCCGMLAAAIKHYAS